MKAPWTEKTEKEIYFEDVKNVIEHVMTELDRRFSDENLTIMDGISALSPSSQNFLLEESLTSFGELFDCDQIDLKIEIKNCRRMMERSSKDFVSNFPTMMDLCRRLRCVSDALPELCKLTTIACTIPVSSCACERSFSTLRIVKNYLRCTMKNDRANDLLLLGIHSDRAAKIDLNNVIDRFIAIHPKCRILLT